VLLLPGQRPAWQRALSRHGFLNMPPLLRAERGKHQSVLRTQIAANTRSNGQVHIPWERHFQIHFFARGQLFGHKRSDPALADITRPTAHGQFFASALQANAKAGLERKAGRNSAGISSGFGKHGGHWTSEIQIVLCRTMVSEIGRPRFMQTALYSETGVTPSAPFNGIRGAPL
jgi:hypothetical protein